MRRYNNFSTARGLVAALESEEPKVADVELGDNAESLETDLIEVSESTAEGAETEAQIDEAVETAEALEAIADDLAVAAQNGGIDKHAAKALNTAVSFMYARVGVRNSQLPALESYGSNSSRIGATKIAMEDIKGQVAKIWQAIIDAFKKAWKWIEDHFNKVFGSAEKLEKRAQAIEAKAEATTGTPAEKTFESEGIAKYLHVNGTVGGTPSAEAKVVQALAKTIFTEAGKTTEVGEKLLEQFTAADATKTFATTVAIPADNGGVLGMKAVSDAEARGFAAPKKGLTLLSTDELPGGVAITARMPASELKGEAAVEALPGVGYSVEKFNSKAKVTVKAKLNTLTPDECKNLAKVVEEIAIDLRNFRSKKAKISEMKKKFLAAAEKASKDLGAAESDEKDSLKAMQKAAQAYGRLTDQPAVGFSGYALSTGKALLDYAEQSLKQYKGDKK